MRFMRLEEAKELEEEIQLFFNSTSVEEAETKGYAVYVEELSRRFNSFDEWIWYVEMKEHEKRQNDIK